MSVQWQIFVEMVTASTIKDLTLVCAMRVTKHQGMETAVRTLMSALTSHVAKENVSTLLAAMNAFASLDMPLMVCHVLILMR